LFIPIEFPPMRSPPPTFDWSIIKEGEGSETPETKVADVQTFDREPESGVPLPVTEIGTRSAGESHATPVLNKWSNRARDGLRRSLRKAWDVLVKFSRFVGPGFLIAVAYIDPGNYATDVAAGAVTQYSLLFIVLMSNFFAIFLQSLCIKLGSVTGLDIEIRRVKGTLRGS
jgi:hypothetical protein